MFVSFLNRLRHQDKSRPKDFWNGLTVETRQEILEREGFSRLHVQKVCSKRWNKLSMTERIWLFNPLFIEMTNAETRQIRRRLESLNSKSDALVRTGESITPR
jgi:hypothetical protein